VRISICCVNFGMPEATVLNKLKKRSVFHSGIRPGGNAPPPGEALGPPGKFDQKIFIEALPGKAPPPRGEALGPPGKISPGGPTLKIFEALTETRSQCSAAGRRLEGWRRIKWES
jgi:hypothetical protein